jgi:hypothetical protein
MKKYSRNSKKTMKRSMRSKKMSRKRRQRGGGEITLACSINSRGLIAATPSDPSLKVTGSTNTVEITSTTPIKNITFDRAIPATVGSGTGIILTNLANKKSVIPASSSTHARLTSNPRLLNPATQIKLDPLVGMAFPSGLKITNLNVTNLGISTLSSVPATSEAEAGIPFTITIIT